MEQRPPPPQHDRLRSFLRDAGEAALSRFRHAVAERKPDHTLVTDADRAAEQILVRALREAFPEDGVVGEEGAEVSGGQRTWYIDPIDGTHSFLEGLAHWGPMLGLMGPAREPLMGAIWFPRIEEYFFAARGRGAWREGRPLGRLEDRGLEPRSVIYLSSRSHLWFEVDHPCKRRSLGSMAAHLALVAAGSAAGAVVAPGWGPWDVVGGLCLLGECGAVALTLDGAPLDPIGDRSAPFVVGSPAVAEALLRCIRFRPQNAPRG